MYRCEKCKCEWNNWSDAFLMSHGNYCNGQPKEVEDPCRYRLTILDKLKNKEKTWDFSEELLEDSKYDIFAKIIKDAIKER